MLSCEDNDVAAHTDRELSAVFAARRLLVQMSADNGLSDPDLTGQLWVHRDVSGEPESDSTHVQ